jgi:hypothetical protein
MDLASEELGFILRQDKKSFATLKLLKWLSDLPTPYSMDDKGLFHMGKVAKVCSKPYMWSIQKETELTL